MMAGSLVASNGALWPMLSAAGALLVGIVVYGVFAYRALVRKESEAYARVITTAMRAASTHRHTHKRAHVCAITGANSGLGAALAKELAGAGFRVYLGCRSRQRGEAAQARILAAHPSADVRVWCVDVCDPVCVSAGARALMDAEPVVDALFLNAGIMPVMRYNWLTATLAFVYGGLLHFFETGRPYPGGAHFLTQPDDEIGCCGAPALFATHVLGHVMLAQELQPVMPKESRIIWTGSRAASSTVVNWDYLQPPAKLGEPSGAQRFLQRGEHHGETYGEAKHIADLPVMARRLPARCFAICPGFVDTEMTPGFFRALLPCMEATRWFTRGMNINVQRGVHAQLEVLLAPADSLRSDRKYVAHQGAIVEAENGWSASTEKEQEQAYALCESWLKLWREDAKRRK